MGKKQAIKTKSREVANYWVDRLEEYGIGAGLIGAENHCWRCGCSERLDRCHIIPASLGGEDKPENLVLLCSHCHAEAPNIADPEIMWDWLWAYRETSYGSFWNIQVGEEYEKMYGVRFLEEVERIVKPSGEKISSDELNVILKHYAEDFIPFVSNHYGQPYLNIATMAGVLRMAVKRLENEFELTR